MFEVPAPAYSAMPVFASIFGVHQFNGMVVDGSGNVFVADGADASGNIFTILGSSLAEFSPHCLSDSCSHTLGSLSYGSNNMASERFSAA